MLDPDELPLLQRKVGHDIVTTDGTTLLGADDKAGVAEIMAAVAYLKRHPELEHAPIRVCFTVDEEVAGGADHLDLERFGARYAYTLDGAELGEIEAETFNACEGRRHDPRPLDPSRHREGAARERDQARRRLRRRAARATRSRRRRPRSARASSIRTKISGGAEEACVELIVRDHDAAKMDEHVELLRRLAAEIREREPRAAVEVDEEEQYRNMGEVI